MAIDRLKGAVPEDQVEFARPPAAVSHALGPLHLQLVDPLLVRFTGNAKPKPQIRLLANELAQVLRDLRLALESAESLVPTATSRVFPIALHTSQTFTARTIGAIRAVTPNARGDWVQIKPTDQTDPVEGLIDLLNAGGAADLVDGVRSVDLARARVLSFVRSVHPVAQN